MVWRDEVASGEVPVGAEGRSGRAVDADEALPVAMSAVDGKAEVKVGGVGFFFDFPFPFPLAILLGQGASDEAAGLLGAGAAVAAVAAGGVEAATTGVEAAAGGVDAAARGGEAAAGGVEAACEEEEKADGGIVPEMASGLLHSASCC